MVEHVGTEFMNSSISQLWVVWSDEVYVEPMSQLQLKADSYQIGSFPFWQIDDKSYCKLVQNRDWDPVISMIGETLHWRLVLFQTLAG